MHPGDYLRQAGYAKETEALPDTESRWSDARGVTWSFDDACASVMGRCACCGKANSYPGGVRCGAACTAMHEAKDCACYNQLRN
jgi:hypothetical protein